MTGKLGALALVAALAAASSPARAQDKGDKADDKEAAQQDVPPGGDPCIDEEVKADLFAKRRQRTSRDRLFQQTNRHELTIRNGYYVSDTFDGVLHQTLFTVGGVRIPALGVLAFAYSYHMTEDLAVEATAALTHLSSNGGPELERTFAVLEGKTRQQLMFDANLVYSLAHAKIRLGGSITHFDFTLTAGAGVVDSAISRDIAGNGGIGLKFFLGRAWAFRIDVRDHVFRQQLLSEAMVVNDISVTAGLSIYLPMRE